jgi:DNA-binding beta-propeller fold protein YncE
VTTAWPPRRAVLAAVIVAVGMLLVPARPGAAPIAVGTLRQIAGPRGCLAAPPHLGCSRAPSLTNIGDVVVSPDGRSVYLSSSNGVFALSRHPRTGTLTRLGRTAFAQVSLAGARLTISPDETTVYAAAGSSLISFARDPTTGALTPLGVDGGCFSAIPLSGCVQPRVGTQDVSAFTDNAVSALAISSDGRTAYATWSIEGSPGTINFGREFAALLGFVRDPATGALTQLEGDRACLTTSAVDGCTQIRFVDPPELLRTPVISDDGRNVYVLTARGVLGFTRDPATGALSQLLTPDGCIAKPPSGACATLRPADQGVLALTLSPDGASAYIASEGSLAAFARSAVNGGLQQLPGRAACLTPGGEHRCASARALVNPNALATSRDGRNVYVAAREGIVALARNPRSGRLHQLAGTAGCINAGGRDLCNNGTGLEQPQGITLSPDAANAYVTFAGVGNEANVLAVFRRIVQSARPLCSVTPIRVQALAAARQCLASL